MTGLFGLLVLLMIALAGARILPRIRLWRAGASAPVDWHQGLLALPRRYLHDVHAVVARDPYAARMHALVAGGLLAASALAVLTLLPPLGSSRLFAGLVALAFLAMLLGSLAVGARRYPRKPPRLSGGAFQVLPFLLLGYALGGLLASGAVAFALPAPFGWAGLVLAAAGGLGLAWSTGAGPMRHAVTGALWLAAHPRPARFGTSARDTALRPLDLDASKLGAEVPADWTWNRLLSFDACIQCGRCEAACPAFAAGQPLNPKRLVQDLAAAQTPGGNPAYSGSPYPNARATTGVSDLHAPVIGEDALIHPDTLWSCTTCRACVAECPMMIEHVDAVIDLRRFQTLELGAVPIHAEAALAHARGADEPNGQPLRNRTDFAPDLPLMRDRGEADILLWLGTSAFDLRTGRTLRALVALLRAAQVDFAVLGDEERDCGDLARRLGDEATFQRLAGANIETLGRYRFRRILTADPHSLHTLRNEYPALGGHFAVVHHTAFLDELAASGALALEAARGEAVTFHDPCYLARYNGEVDAPRRLLDRLGVERREMARSGTRAMCCGGGGGAPLSDVAGERRIPDIRMGQARETGAALVVAACPQCTLMLEGVAGERPDVLDIAELTLRSLAPAPAARTVEPA